MSDLFSSVGVVALRWAFIAVIIGFVTIFWSRINYSRPTRRQPSSDENITPGKISAAIVTLSGVATALFGIALIFYGMLMTALICIIAGGALSIFMGPSLTHRHDVNWNFKGVTGPSRLFGPSLGYSRTTIEWDDIVSTGKTSTEYWFIQDSDGQRIYWSYLYPGYGRLVETLKLKRPQVALPDDLR